MKILHPYVWPRPEDQKETWAFLDSVRSTYQVVDRLNICFHAYADFIAQYWGVEDLIILEADNVPSLDDLKELIACRSWGCYFPYQMYGLPITTMQMWKDRFPFTLGFVKFTKEAQLAVPTSIWRTGPLIDIGSIDHAIEMPMILKFGPMHMHERPVKHNHGTGVFVAN